MVLGQVSESKIMLTHIRYRKLLIYNTYKIYGNISVLEIKPNKSIKSNIYI